MSAPESPFPGDGARLSEQVCANCGSTQLRQDTDGVWHCSYCRSTFRAADPAMIVVSTPVVQSADDRVIDTADLLTHDQQVAIDARFRQIAADDDVILVAETVNTITENVERYARRRAQELGVGDDAKDNGLFILLVREPRRIQVQAGNGISTHLGGDDIDAVVREQAVPVLKSGDIPAGILAAADGLVRVWRENRDAGRARSSSVASADPGSSSRSRHFADGETAADTARERRERWAQSSEESPRSRGNWTGFVILLIAIVLVALFSLQPGGGGTGSGGGWSPGTSDDGGGWDGGGYDGGGYDGGGGGGGFDGGDFDGGTGGGSDW